MKTTIELAGPLFHTVKSLAAQQQTTLRALVEEGLRLVIQQRQVSPAHTFKLRDARFDGRQAIWPESHEWRDLETQDIVKSMRLSGEQEALKPQ